MKLSKIMLAGAFAVFALTGCSLDKTAIINVNGKPITKAQYEEAYKQEISSPQYKSFASMLKEPDNIMSLATKDRVVNELILKEIIRQEIEKREITATDEEIAAKKAEIAEQLGSVDKVNDILRKNGVSEKQYTEDIENEIKINKLIGETKIPDKEAKDFYNSNKSAFDYPERVRASHILIEANPAKIKQEIISQDKKGKLTSDEIDKKVQEALDSKMKFAQEVRAKAASNPSEFASIAKQYSDDKLSGQKGGDLGFFPREAMVKPFSDAAFSLKPNTVSEIVVTDYGNHIIIVTDRAKAGMQPFEKVKDEISAYLEQKKKVEVMQNMLDGLKASSKVEYLDESFDPNKIQEQIKQKSKEQEEALKAQMKEAQAAEKADKTVPPEGKKDMPAPDGDKKAPSPENAPAKK